jgi:hypothetical protein
MVAELSNRLRLTSCPSCLRLDGMVEGRVTRGRGWILQRSFIRMMKRIAVSFLLLFSFVFGAYGAVPILKELHPWGAQRGKAVTVTLVGTGLRSAEVQVVSSLPASFTPLTKGEKQQIQNANQDEILYLVELPTDTLVGFYPIRVKTMDGLSNVLLFSVGAFPEVMEKESEELVHSAVNNSPESSEPIAAPVTVNGTLNGPDRDVYKIHAKKGERLVLDVEARRSASAIDPVIALLDGQRKQIAIANDTPGLGLDCRLDVFFPTGGDYYVVVHDARFSEQKLNFYRLKVGAFAYVEGIFPLGWRRGEKTQVQLIGGNIPKASQLAVDLSGVEQKANFALIRVPEAPASSPIHFAISDLPEKLEPEGVQVTPLEPSTVVNGRISKPGEVDRYKLAVKPKEKWIVELKAAELGTSRLFGRITILDSAGKRLASGGDDIPNPDEFSLIEPGRTSSDPYVSFEAPEGVEEVFVTIEDLVERGGPLFGYRLLATKQPSDFTLKLDSAYVNVPSNGTAIVSVTADRRGYKGPIQLLVPDADQDLIVEGGLIPEERQEADSVFAVSRRGILSITSKEGASPRTTELSVWGEATLEDGTSIRRRARGPGLVTEVLGRTGVPDPNEIDRYRPVLFPWLGFDLPLMVAKEVPARLVVEGPSKIRFVQGTEHQIKWQFQTDSPEIRPPKKVGFDAPGLKEVLISPSEDAKAEYLREGVFDMKAIERVPLQKFNLVLLGEVESGNGAQTIYSRPLTVEVVQGYRIELPMTEITLQPGHTVEVAGKVVREPSFNEPVAIKADSLPDKITSQPVEVLAGKEEFRMVFDAQTSASQGEHQIQLVFSSVIGNQTRKVPYKIPPMIIRLLVSPVETSSELANTGRR